MKLKIFLVGLVLLMAAYSCQKENDFGVTIPNFNFPSTITFQQNLSDYGIYEGDYSKLVPGADFVLFDLSSVLYTDYAHKQRLIKVPNGTQVSAAADGSLIFPDGTILTKTFYYYHDDRDTSLGRRIIETRLLIKENGTWNIATYVWNQSQTDATLDIDGFDSQVSWINMDGQSKSTSYHVPTQNECMTCHQVSSTLSPIGPSLLNLNRDVERNGTTINQLTHLQSEEVLSSFSITGLPQMVDYIDEAASVSSRARAYLAINCAHCHNPKAWDVPARRDFDFRHETPFSLTGIAEGKDEIRRNLTIGEMPFIGTTLIHDEGVALMVEYLNGL